ncbi:zinc finger protein 592 [Genypterus blacodes]|uniref:zinc finger protein 592 n=1 Tax=Genypterus blacodes TaxID=154954 RepID=UPI003F769458
MGDMKTPDFDDLLAAFDIPDATGLDAKESIQESHEETESQLKHGGMCLDDGLLGNQTVTAADVPAVSVIVKNTSRQDSVEVFIDRLHSEPAVQNGFRGQETSVDFEESTHSDFSKSFVTALNGDSPSELFGKAPIQPKPDGTPMFSQSFSHFSPISSPESEDTQCSRDEIHPKQDRHVFPDASVLAEPCIPDNPKKLSLSLFDDCPQDSDIPKNTQRSATETTRSEQLSHSDQTATANTEHGALPPPNGDRNSSPTSHPHSKSQASKLSSCLEALVALNARKDPSEPTSQREISAIPNDCVKATAKVPVSPRSPRSPLGAVKRLMRPSDSPVSICSDSSGKASPAMASGSPPAIPRVRIKTIKTMSGQIKRTVTSVLPDSETDDVQSAYESSPSQSMVSEDSCCPTSPHQAQNAAVESAVGPQTKVSASSSKVVRNKSEAASRKSGLKQSPTIFHNSCGPVKRSVAHLRQKPKRMTSAAPGQTASTNFLPKAIHLASLNLVPHSVAASAAARSATHQQSQPALSSPVCSTVPLVHQIKTASTPPPTTTTSVPNTAAGTLNRLLNNANPVPTYVPDLNPPPECNINLPPRGYCCLECGDAFGVERSLAYHYGRRSVHIEVGCTHCSKTLVFFNKCALLAHAREHKNSGMVMQCTQLYMKPIAQEQMFLPLNAESGLVESRASPSPAPKSQPVMPLYPDNVIRHRLRCLECDKQLPDYKALAGHYQRLSDDTEGLMCKVCSMLLPNKCSFRAHQRIHAHKSPYCCPECGALSRSADIQKHVKENCLHHTRKAWYKCLHCDMVFKTVQGQKTHIEEKHCNVLYKCSICPVAFKTSEGCEVHLNNKHNGSKMSPQLIFKCSCETVFKKKQLFFQHFLHNATKRVTCVFKCPECTSVFPQKQQIMQHFKNMHAGNVRANAEKNGKQADKSERSKDAPPPAPQQQRQQHGPGARKHTGVPRKKAEQSSRPRTKPSGWTCGECLQRFPERDAYVSHMKAEHRRSLKRYPCRHCEQSFKSANSLRRHVRTDHDGKKRIYTCWYCTDTKKIYATSVMLKNHISLMHGIKNPDLGLMPKTHIQESKKPLREGLISKRTAAGTKEEGPDHSNTPGAPSAKRPKSQYRCSKCGFTTEDSAQFQQHIPQHKTGENTPQCLHCGLCFTSVLSLNRHRFIVHKVKDSEEEGKKGEEREASAKAREKEKVREALAKAREKEKDDRPIKSTQVEVNDVSARRKETEPSQVEEAADCNVKLRTDTQAASRQY